MLPQRSPLAPLLGEGHGGRGCLWSELSSDTEEAERGEGGSVAQSWRTVGAL